MVLRYGLPERRTTETMPAGDTYEFAWRGDEIVGVAPTRQTAAVLPDAGSVETGGAPPDLMPGHSKGAGACPGARDIQPENSCPDHSRRRAVNQWATEPSA